MHGAKSTLRICKQGHPYYKSSDCPACPKCEELKKLALDFYLNSQHRQEGLSKIMGSKI